jgi:hypothetical protein
MTLLIELATKFGPYIAAFIGIVGAYFGIKAKGASDARAEDRAQTNQQSLEAVKEVQDVQAKTRSMSDDAVYADLDKWVSDGKGPRGK